MTTKEKAAIQAARPGAASNTFDTDNHSIHALTTARRCRCGVWALTVLICPFCGKTHHHGGGDGDTPTLGHRAAHCAKPGIPPGYVLVASEVPYDKLR